MTVDEEPPFDPDYDTPPAYAGERLHLATLHHTNGFTEGVPQDATSEAALIGAALLDPHVLTATTNIVTPADFWRPAHETIWRHLATAQAAGEPTDPATLAARLRDTGERIEPTYLADLLTAAAPAVDTAIWHAHRIDALARRRTAITHLTRGLQQLRQPGPDEDVDNILNTTLNELTTARDTLTNPTPPTTWTPVDLTQVLAGEMLDPPPTILLRDDGTPLFYDGAVHTVSGESESGKTWLTLLAARQLLEQAQPVTFIDFEDRADRVVGRLLSLGATPGDVRAHFSYIRPDRPLDDDGRHQIIPAINTSRLVIIDGVTEAMTLHGFDLNSNADSALFQTLLPRWIADHGPAVCMIDHVVKDKEKQDRFALGAQHKLAGIDGAAYIVKVIEPFARGKTGRAKVEVAKDRPGHVREFAHGRTIAEFTLESNHDGTINIPHLIPPAVAKSGGDIFTPTYLMEKVSRYVEANPGMSKKAIEATLNGKTDVKRLALELLVTRGYIGVKTGPRGAIQHYSNRPFRDDQDDTDDAENTPTDPWETPSHTADREAS